MNSLHTEKRQELIDRINREKGGEVVPTLLQLVAENPGDAPLMELVAHTLRQMTPSPWGIVRRVAKEKLEYFRDFPEEWSAGGWPETFLMIADLLGDVGDEKDSPFLLHLMEMYDEERAQLIMIESLCKLGHGEPFLDLLEYYLYEDLDREVLCDQVFLCLAHVNANRARKFLVASADFAWLTPENRQLLREAIFHQLAHFPDAKKSWENDPAARSLLDSLQNEQEEGSIE